MAHKGVEEEEKATKGEDETKAADKEEHKEGQAAAETKAEEKT